MSESIPSRRDFLRSSSSILGGAWLAANLPLIRACALEAQAAAQAGEGFQVLKPEEAIELEALAVQIFPTDDTPGAHEAGVIHFIDRALNSFASEVLGEIREGLSRLQAVVQEQHPDAGRFGGLTFQQQTRVLKELEGIVKNRDEDDEGDRSQEGESEREASREEQIWAFFEVVRTLTVSGMFANSSYGGNRDEIGWKILGFEDAHVFEPPFGYYDAEYTGVPLEQEGDGNDRGRDR